MDQLSQLFAQVAQRPQFTQLVALTRGRLHVDLGNVIDASVNQVRLRREETQEFAQFFDNLKALVHNEAPGFDAQLRSIGDIFAETLAAEATVTNAEERLAEDLNDISARFNVIYRLTEEGATAQRRVHACTETIERLRRSLAEDQSRGGQRQFKLQGDLDAAVRAKHDAVLAAINKLQELINAKRRYNRMKLRRLRHGYGNLGEVSEREYDTQTEKARQLAVELAKARDTMDQALEGARDEPPFPLEGQPPSAEYVSSKSLNYAPPGGYGDSPF